MRFKLTLAAQKGSLIPINYQYPLSACIYKIIQRADTAFAAFLHDTGYRVGGKTFKLFTFSDLGMQSHRIDDRLQLLGTHAELLLAFHIPEAAEKFIIGLFKDQRMELADQKSRALFEVTHIESLPGGLPLNQELQQVILEPLSAIVTGPKNEKGNYIYLSPEHPDFTHGITHNWREKWTAVNGATDLEQAFAGFSIRPLFGKYPPKSRLMTIKAGTPEETQIRGFTRFDLQITANSQVLELGLNSGLGLYNALGCGFMGVVGNT